MTPAAIERNYPKRLLKAGWRHMSLFQQPASEPRQDCGFGSMDLVNGGEVTLNEKHDRLRRSDHPG